MKIWLKTVLAAAAGILLGAVLAQRDGANAELMSNLSRIAVQIGRYAVFPVIFFGLVVGTHELRQAGRLARVYGRLLLYTVAATVLLTLIGLASVVLLAPQRIPIIIVEEQVYALPGLLETAQSIFPTNLFQVLVGNGALLIPLLVLAIVVGLNLGFDLAVTKPVIQLGDSLSRIFFHINALLVEVFWVAVVIISAATLINLSKVELTLYRELLVILSIDVVVLYFGVFPGLLYLLGEPSPFRWLYASLGPALIGAVTGDHHVSLSALVLHGRASFGLPRMITSIVYPFFAVFGRAGTALVSSVTFVLIVRSYSSFEVSLVQLLWVGLFSFLISFAVGGVPGLGAMVSLAALSSLYGRGLQEGYLIMQPIAPLLISVGVLLDVTTSALVALLIGQHEHRAREVPVREFT